MLRGVGGGGVVTPPVCSGHFWSCPGPRWLAAPSCSLQQQAPHLTPSRLSDDLLLKIPALRKRVLTHFMNVLIKKHHPFNFTLGAGLFPFSS